MSVHTTQTIAANMTLIVVALLAATLIVMVPTWRRFLDYWSQSPPKPWRSIMSGSGLLMLPTVLLLAAGTISVWISADTWYYEFRYVLILMMLALSLPIYFYVIPRWLLREVRYTKTMTKRAHSFGCVAPLGSIGTFIFALFRRSRRGLGRRGDAKMRRQPDLSKEIGTLAALGCFAETIFLCLLVTMAAIPVAIGVGLGGQTQEENFEYARAMIVVMPTIFACGLGCLGLSYLEELRQRIPNSK